MPTPQRGGHFVMRSNCGLSVDACPHIGPLGDEVGLLGGHLCKVHGNDAGIEVGGEVALVVDIGGVGAAGTGRLFTGELEIGGGENIEDCRSKLGMRAVLDHCGGEGADGVALDRPHDLNVVRAAHQQGDRAVVVGQAHGVLAVIHVLVARGGAGGDNAVAVLHELALVIPRLLIAELVAHEVEHGLELTPCGRGGGGVGLNDLALQLRLEKVGVAVDVNAKLREDLRVLDEADVLIGEIGVVAVGLHRAVGGVLRGVLLKEVDVLVAVGLGEAAEDDVSLRIFLFRIDTGGQLAEGAADELNVNIGVKLVENAEEHFVVNVGLRAVDDDGAGKGRFLDGGIRFRIGGCGRFRGRGLGGGGLLAAGAQRKDHGQREDKCE